MTREVAQQDNRQLNRPAVSRRRVDGCIPWSKTMDRRGASRVERYQAYSYERVERFENEAAVIETGRVFTVNQSAGGMLLLMSRVPDEGQCVELHSMPILGQRTAYLLEVRWTKPVRIESEGELYLVGCQRTFGPCHYFQF
jgi:hypothetical protein